MNFKLIDTNRYYLEGTQQRFIHVASIGLGLREFMLMLDTHTQKAYCEEITSGRLIQIEEDNLLEDIIEFVREHKLLQVKAGAPLKEQPFGVNK
jgi:hypothetical protein